MGGEGWAWRCRWVEFGFSSVRFGVWDMWCGFGRVSWLGRVWYGRSWEEKMAVWIWMAKGTGVSRGRGGVWALGKRRIVRGAGGHDIRVK